MSNTKRSLSLSAVLFCAAALLGCGDGNEMSKKDIDGIKNSPKMTDGDRKVLAAGMAAGGEAHRKKQADWAKENADKVAQINAERAKMGRPPLGQ